MDELRFVLLTAEWAARIAPWFDDPDTRRYLGGQGWLECELELMRSAPGLKFGGVGVLARYVWIVCDALESPVGLIDVELYEDQTASMALLVAPEKRGQGIGGCILYTLENLLKPWGVCSITGGIEVDNRGARRCVEKAGYVVAKTPDKQGFFHIERRLSGMAGQLI